MNFENISGMKSGLIWIVVLLFLGLSTPGLSEELWVRNRPFPGEVRGTGQSMLVEADTFLKTLEIEAEDRGDVFIIGGFPIPVEKAGTIRLIPLRDVVDAAGLSISKNPSLGTVDVRVADAGKGPSGTWNTDSSSDSDSSGSASKGEKTQLEGATFRVTVPGHLSVVAESTYLKSGETDNAKAAQINNPLTQSAGARQAFAVTTRQGPKMGLLSVSMIMNMDPNLTAKDEKELLAAIGLGVLERGGRIYGEPTTQNIAGKKYYKFLYDDNGEYGQQNKNEVYVHFSTKHERAFLMLLSAPKRKFNRIAPQLRLVVRNLRIK